MTYHRCLDFFPSLLYIFRFGNFPVYDVLYHNVPEFYNAGQADNRAVNVIASLEGFTYNFYSICEGLHFSVPQRIVKTQMLDFTNEEMKAERCLLSC